MEIARTRKDSRASFSEVAEDGDHSSGEVSVDMTVGGEGGGPGLVLLLD